MNLTDEPHTLYRGTRIGEVHVITKCDQVEGLLPATPPPPRDVDDSNDSDDQGWLRDRRVKYHPKTTFQGRATFRPTRVDVRMDPADMSEYLQTLMEWAAYDLTL